MHNRRARGRRVAVAASFALVSLVTAGCSPFGGGTDDGDVELTVLGWDGGGDNKALEDMIAGFEAANPGIKVKATYVPEDTYVTKLKTALVADPPDIAYAYGWDLMFGFTPLNDIFEENDIDIEAYSDVVETGCAWDGTYYCFGTTVGSMVTFYNKAIFDEKGIPYPDASTPMTFEEMSDLAAQLTTEGASEEETVWGAGMSLLVAYMDPADYLDPTGRTVEVTTPEFTESVQIISDMVADGTSPSAGQVETLGGASETLFLDGKLAMLISDNYTIDLIEATDLEYGIAPTPVVPGSDPWIVSWTSGFSVPLKAKHPDEAGKFIAYLAQEGQEIQAGFGLMPTELATAEEWADTPERQQLVEVNKLIRTSVFNPNIWAWNAPIVDALTATADGAPVDQTMADAEPKAQQGNDTTWEQFDRALEASGLE